jgi:hypothetical protein
MIDPGEREVLEKAMKINWVIWGAMLSSIGIYVLVAHLTEGKVRIGAGLGDVFGLLRILLLAFGLLELLLIPFIKKLVLKNVRPPKTTAAMGITGPGSHPAVAAYTSALVVSLAIAESVAIYGLLLFFLGGDFQTLYLFAALGACGMIVSRPKMAELEHLATRMKTGGAA